MVAAMEAEDRRSSGGTSSRDSLEEIIVIPVLEDESSRDDTPDGGIFSGASEASASNDCEFELSRRTVLPLSGKGHEFSSRATLARAHAMPCPAMPGLSCCSRPQLKSGKSLIRG